MYAFNTSNIKYQGSIKGKKSAKNVLPCLNKNCDKKYYVQDCPITFDEDKKRLMDAMRAEKPKKKEDESTCVSALVATPKPPLQVSQNREIEDDATQSAIVFASISGHSFACRIHSGADELAILDTIIKFFENQLFYRR